jgi:outer membrane protein TolC
VTRVSLDLERDALAAFYVLWERRGEAEVIDEQLTLAEQVAAAVTARFQAGQGSQGDMLRAQAEIERLHGERAAQADLVAGAEAMLTATMGLPTTTAVPKLTPPSLDRAPPSLDDSLGSAEKIRPELGEMDARIDESDAQIDVMKSMYSPMAFLRAGPSYTMTEGNGVMLIVGVSIPLWRGKLSAGVREAKHMAAMAREDRAAMSRVIEGDVASARADVLAARERTIALRDKIVPTTQQAVDAELVAYASGQVPLVSVLDALGALWTARRDLIASEAELGDAWAQFDRAIGGP